MSCTSFLDCVGNPISGLPAETTFQTLSGTTIFAVNLSMYLFYALLVVFTVYFLFKTIYALIGASDSAENYERFRAGLTNAIFASIGIIMIFSVRFFILTILRFFGIVDADNPFL